jgi:hypothetical protein
MRSDLTPEERAEVARLLAIAARADAEGDLDAAAEANHQATLIMMRLGAPDGEA